MRRRDLIRNGVLAGIGAVTALGAGARGSSLAEGMARAGRRTPVRNIIFFAYDGFNYEDLALARYFAARQGMASLELEAIMAAGSTGSMLSHSLTSVVTDSAAASTAWSTGRKVVNGALSMYPDGRRLTTILDLARDAGKATGLITTTRLTHATPAGWAATVEDRGMEDEVAEQYVARRIDVLLGGGRRHFTAADRPDGRDLEAEFAALGHAVVHTAAELGRVRTGRILGAFTDDHLPYEIDRRHQGIAAPSLAEIAGAGLAALARHPGGFVAQIEAGRIDHANHDNDPGAAVWDILAADQALAVVRRFVDDNPGTLLIIASDHATGGQSVYGFGSGYLVSTPALETLARRRASHDFLRSAVLDEVSSAGEVRAAVAEYLGVPLTGRQADDAARALAGDLRAGHPNGHGGYRLNSFYQVISVSPEWEPDRPNINFATAAHTAGLVPLVAYGAWDGPGALGVVDNTELFGWMTRALGVDYENPLMTEAEALRLASGRARRELAVR